jgi:hypothetical protein
MTPLRYKLLPLFLLLPWITNAQNFGGNPASQKWWQVNTDKSRVIFPKGLDSQAQRISNVVNLLDSITLYSIGQNMRKWNIVLLNQTTEANAYVRLAPVISEFYMTPSQDNFSFGSLRWDDNLIIHEDRHMQQFSNFNHGFTKVFSFFLGQEGQLLANGIAIPDYFFEGDAVWQETLVSKQGRGRMPAFYNGMKSLWIGNKKFNWMQLRNGSLRKYFPDHYELGYPMLLYGYEKYGEDFWRKVTTDAVDFKGLFYAFNKAVKRHSGKSYSQFTRDALDHYKEQTLGTPAPQDSFAYVTPAVKNNVVDYLYPQFVSDDTVVVTKQSYKEINSFYLLVNGREEKIRVKDYVQDEYFSYRNGKLVYAAYQSDPRWTNRNYSVLKLVDIYTQQQVQLTHRTKYFSPDINQQGTEVLAVSVNEDGSNYLHRLDAASGALIKQVPNPGNYFFTQTKYIDNTSAVSAVRNPAGEMALVKVDLNSGAVDAITSFGYNVLGYPMVKDGLVYFAMTDYYSNDKNLKPADRIFAVSLSDKKLYRISGNINGVYQPAVNSKNELLFSAFTADGWRLAKTVIPALVPAAVVDTKKTLADPFPGAVPLKSRGANVLDSVAAGKSEVSRYRKSFQLLNFHSARPFADDPEFGYTFYSDNILTSFHSELTYTFNRNEQSHAVGYDLVYSGAFPFLRAGIERSFNRKVDVNTTTGVRTFNYAATKLSAGASLPLNFINGRTLKYVNIGAAYNAEYLPYQVVGKDVNTRPLNYLSSFFVFSNSSRKPKQFINPAWAQTLTVTYRDAFNIIDNRKLVADASLYFPGLFLNHSLVIDGAYQHRDTFPDFFSKTFAFSRGYQELNQRRMYKIGVNYHFPLLYPDWGFGNMIFFQRVRVNAFYDYGSSLTKFNNGQLLEIKNRSTGAELHFDTKVWNALPLSFGVRYSRLLDPDLLNPGAVNRWEIIVPIGLIPD